MTDTPTTIRLPGGRRQALADEAAKRGMKPATLAVKLIEDGLVAAPRPGTAVGCLNRAVETLDSLLPEGGTAFENGIVNAVGHLADAVAAML